MATKKATGFDFAALDTVKLSTDGKYFPFFRGTDDELDAGATMLGQDSPQFKRAHAKVKAEISKMIADNKKAPVTTRISDEEMEVKIDEHERTEMVIECCVSLHNCALEGRDMVSRDDIREFFSRLPMMRDQMWFRIKGRAHFLPDAAIAG